MHEGVTPEKHAALLLQIAAALPDRESENAVSYWPEDFFEETYGSLADDPIERLPQGEYETREPLL